MTFWGTNCRLVGLRSFLLGAFLLVRESSQRRKVVSVGWLSCIITIGTFAYLMSSTIVVFLLHYLNQLSISSLDKNNEEKTRFIVDTVQWVTVEVLLSSSNLSAMRAAKMRGYKSIKVPRSTLTTFLHWLANKPTIKQSL